MPILVNYHKRDRYLTFLLKGKVTQEDYEEVRPDIERLLEENERLHLIVEFRDFEGWTPAGIMEDIKFNVGHAEDFQRVAIISDERWKDAVAVFSRPFTSAQIRFFEPYETAEARQWVKQVPETQPTAPE